ncbi:MAG: hypothetical protein QOE93_1822, partial [Actinomycetota bacterium]|nr:hypothetical protein [Actinomycetota bacterium]
LARPPAPVAKPAAAAKAKAKATPVETEPAEDRSPAAVASRLVRADIHAVPAPAVRSPFEIETAVARPDRIVRYPGAIADLLEEAMDEGWPVRLAYTSKKGRTAQLNVGVLDVSAQEVIVELLSGWESRVLALGRIEWARVLTEAEEDAL